jgi:hypothetical protein
MEQYINIKSKKRLKNPCIEALNNEGTCYSGPITNFTFKRPGLNQQNNYEILQSTLLPFGIQLTHICAGTDTIYGRIRTTFIAKSQNNEFFWYKYEGPSPGSGQNYLYVHGEKIKFTKWLSWTVDERINFVKNLLNDDDINSSDN